MLLSVAMTFWFIVRIYTFNIITVWSAEYTFKWFRRQHESYTGIKIRFRYIRTIVSFASQKGSQSSWAPILISWTNQHGYVVCAGSLLCKPCYCDMLCRGPLILFWSGNAGQGFAWEFRRNYLLLYSRTKATTTKHGGGVCFCDILPADLPRLNSCTLQVVPEFNVFSGSSPTVEYMKQRAGAPSFFMPIELRQAIMKKQTLAMLTVDTEHDPCELFCVINRGKQCFSFKCWESNWYCDDCLSNRL